MRNQRRTGLVTSLTVTATTLLGAALATAFSPKEALDQLDLLAFVDPNLRVVEVTADAAGAGESVPGLQAMEDFRAAHGNAWRFTVDLRRGVPTLLGGGAIPFIPGRANDLPWEQIAPGCQSNDCIPVAAVEALARDFITANADALGFRPEDLVLDPAGSGPFGDNLYFLRFDWTIGGVEVEHASVFFRINGGNLIQVASEHVARAELDTTPRLAAVDARAIVEDYLGPFGALETDLVLDGGSLRFVPVTPAGQDPDRFDGEVGSGIGYRLAWRFAFQRQGVTGTWEAVVDAHTGDLLRFVDTNQYGRVHGGAYPGDNHTGEADRPFPFADTGLPAPDQYADAGGLFPGDSATTRLQGKYARINDACGAISNTTTTGDVDFGLGPGTDCAVPSPNNGGAGNTHAARTQYYHLTSANLRAQAWMPGNSWLQSSYITVNTNGSPQCNASSGGGTLYFYRSASGCWNLGEIPGVALHEWGHSLDNFDGSGGQSRPVETYADWMAALHLHDSCVGRGFLLSGNCSGYGDPCTDCTGIRDIDYTKHVANTPWSAANYGTIWFNSGSSYYGPCGIGSHAEGGIAAQALWDLVSRKLAAAPFNLDERTAWILADRLWYLGIPSLGYNMYSCSIPNSDGCGGSSLYSVMMAVDDDGDGTANGTPHASAIYSALADHNIACGTASDPQNQNSSSCPSLGAAVLSGVGENNSAALSWTAVPGAARYAIFRSDIGCDAGLTRIAVVDAPATTYTDTTVVNDIEYYYLVQPLGSTDACFGPVSNCATVIPIPCEIPATPTSLTASAAGDNQISLSWTSSDPGAATFNVYRAVGTCPQPDYELIASDVAVTSYLDTTVSGGLDYAYVVSAKDVTGGCESASTDCAQAQTTGDCIEAPAFNGLQSLTNPGLDTCTLDLGWNPATAYCGGPVSYNVYRSDLSGFEPSPANLVASGVVGAGYSDASDVQAGVAYYYIVRAVDGANGIEDGNTEELTGSPTGPSSVRFSDDFESGNQGWTFSRGTPQASTGDFLIGDPVATTGNYGDPSQPGDDHTPGAGVNCLYSDENPTGDAGFDDIDGGEVIATSPTFDGSDAATLEINLWRWFFNEDTDDSGDYYFLEVSDDDGGSWSVVETIPDSVTDTNSWFNVVADMAQVVTPTPTMKVRVRAADGPAAGDLVELAIDDLVITGAAICTPGSAPLPGSFGKSSPADGASGQPYEVTLTWGTSLNATNYEYCVDTSDNDACEGPWTSAPAGTTAQITGLDPDTTYFWQVRAVNGQGSTPADGGSWWDFTTETLPLPGAFTKVDPPSDATGQPTELTLSWSASANASGYEVCVDTVDNGSCDGSWNALGDVTTADVDGLAEWTTYFWQVRAVNGNGATTADGGSWWWFVTTPYLFGDDFESGATSAWSEVTD